ncbi:MAG: 2-phospho-L-lactate transferase CofD family protein [Solirubrobacteraceae bacterium]
MSQEPVVILAGGTGGAKLARGMLDVVGEDLVVIANTGDDIELYGAYVSPDPDLITFWLADRIDARGWGLRDDTFQVMDGLRELGVDVWFNLGDKDLAIGLERARRLDEGETLTEAQQAISDALKVPARILPMADQPVRTRVLAGERWWPLQEFLIRQCGQGEVRDVDFRGRGAARPTPGVLEAVETARAIIIGPSNPAISIGPILTVPGMAEAIQASRAPTVAVSPIVNGAILKGPTEAFMRWRGQPLDAAGVAAMYAPLLDGIVATEPAPELPTLETDTLMDTPDRRRRLAERALSFALDLA